MTSGRRNQERDDVVFSNQPRRARELFADEVFVGDTRWRARAELNDWFPSVSPDFA